MDEPTTVPPAWLRDLPLTPGPPFVAMGLRAVEPAAWLVMDDDYTDQVALKDATTSPDTFAALPGTDAAGYEVLALVTGWIDAHGPTVARARLAEVRASSSAISRSAHADRHPLLHAALLVQEDLCVMAPGEDGYVLAAAAVHFPSHWRLADKIGRPMARIHEPVRHYADDLAVKADRFFDRLAPGRLMVRRNVSIHDHDDLYRPEPPETYEDVDGAFDRLWVRTERQTLRRLSGTTAPTGPAPAAAPAEPGPAGDVLFTIKTEQCPLPVVRQVPDVAHGLAAKLRAIRADAESAGLPVHAPAGIADWLDEA